MHRVVEIVPGFHGDIGVYNACNAGIIGACTGIECPHDPCEGTVYRNTHQNDPQWGQPALVRKAVHQQKRSIPPAKANIGVK